MIYIAAMPSWVLIVLVLFSSFKLVTAYAKITVQKLPLVASFIFYSAIAMLGAGLFAVYFTYENSISWEACRLGSYGRYGSFVILLMQGLVFLHLMSANSIVVDIAAYKPFISAIVTSSVIVFVIFLRSYLRCTV